MGLLTEAQQKLVEENHSLIYKFAKIKNLMLDEYYDLLAIGLCRAAKIFNENKGKFSTIAYNCMQNEIDMYWRHINRKTAVPNEMILSYDASTNEENSKNQNSYLRFFASNHSTHDVVVNKITIEKLVSLLTEKEKIIVKFLIKGMTREEVAEKLNCKRQNVEYYIKLISKKWANFLTKC